MLVRGDSQPAGPLEQGAENIIAEPVSALCRGHGVWIEFHLLRKRMLERNGCRQNQRGPTESAEHEGKSRGKRKRSDEDEIWASWYLAGSHGETCICIDLGEETSASMLVNESELKSHARETGCHKERWSAGG